MRHAVCEMGELLSLRKVRLHHVRGQRHVVRVLEGVSLRVRAGEVVCVWGQRGQGKTTLLKVAARLARPAGGEVFFEGRDLWGLADEQRAGLLGGGIGWVDPVPTPRAQTSTNEVALGLVIERSPRAPWSRSV
jgi:predicted ABC-type transport system involved in lysophospholipase L1 biosynthesis ATPase subunit